MLFPTLITTPIDTPVTLAEAKAHLRVDYADDDAMIGAIISAAVAHLDGFTGILGRALMPQTWSQEYAGFTGDLVLPFGPIISVSSVAYDGNTFDDYRLLADGRGPFLRVNDGESWPSTSEPVVVTFQAGYADAASVPSPIKSAILLHIGTLYEYRETLAEKVSPSMAYEALLSPYRTKAI